MHSSFYGLIILTIFAFSLQENILPRLTYDTKEIPKYSINLDLPVKERYKNILISYKDKVKVYAKVTTFAPLAYIISKVGKSLLNPAVQDPEWVQYIEAVAEFCDIPLSQAVMLSVTYDMACTSAIIQDNKDNIFMGRNLDFGTYFVISHLMIEVDYYRNGNYLYTGVELVGFRGAINAIKPGKFATSLNLRRSYNYKLGNLYRVYQGKLTPNFNLMKVMEKADSYEEALNLLSKTELSAPVFYGLSGIHKNEGAIISREYDGIYRIDSLDVDNGKWFLVVCNTDLDKDEPETNFRRVPTEENISGIGRDKINFKNLFSDVMSVYPTNNIITAYTTIQSSQGKGFFNTTIWMP